MQKLFFVFGFLLNTYFVFSQNDNKLLQPVIPPSPNAAAIGRYGEVPVGMYTGVPEISVPIFEIKTGRIKFPIALSYHAGGIRVEDVASWVGLGWSLSSPGMITRTIRGLPDDNVYATEGGYMDENMMPIERILHGPNLPASQDSIIWYNKKKTKIVTRQEDGEPDLYNLSLPGLSCKFFYNQQRKTFITTPASKIQISFSGILISANEWNVIDQNGIIYSFTAHEKTNSPWDVRQATSETITSWLLTSIYDPVYNKTVNFSYQTVNLNYLNGRSEVGFYPVGNSQLLSSGGIVNHWVDATQLRLTRISYQAGIIDFNVSSTLRVDLQNDKALASIHIKNSEGTLIKKVVLNTSYFEFNRLRLDGLDIYGKDETSPQKYIFEYNPILCNNESLSQDLWGYYNGASNTSLLRDTYLSTGSSTYHLAGGNREVSPQVNQMGILKKITYPTGGYNEFDYESNYYSIPNTSGYEIQSQTVATSACQTICNQQGQYYYSLSEVNFTVDRPNIGDNFIAWGTVNQLNNDYASGCPNALVSCRVEGINGTSGTYYLNGPNQPFTLPNGDYKLIAEFQHCYQDYFIDAQISLHIKNNVYTGNTVIHKYVGGLRIKEIRTVEPNSLSTIKKTYEYTSPNQPQYSSGMIPLPYIDMYRVAKFVQQDEYGVLVYDTYYKRQSFSCISLATSKTSYIGYTCVTEKYWKGNELQGYNMNTYTSFPDITDPQNEIPFMPYISRDYMRGMLLSRQVYGIANGSSKLIEETINEYTSIADTTLGTISKGFYGRPYRPSNGDWLPTEDPFTYEEYTGSPGIGIYSEFADKLLLTKTIVKKYDDINVANKIETITEHFYSGSNYEINKTVNQVLGSNRKDIVEMKYPQDYLQTGNSNLDANLSILSALQLANNLNEVIEKNVFVESFSDKKMVRGQFNHFNSNHRLKQIDILRISSPASINKLANSSNGVLSLNSNVVPELEILSYDDDGNILCQRLKNNISNTYLWGYNNNLPISEAINAECNSIAFTSFEPDAKGNWSFSGTPQTDNTAITGNKTYQLTTNNANNITKGDLSPDQTYTISWWAKNGTAYINSNTGTAILSKHGWTLYQKEITNTTSITISGDALIDELRLHPKNAMMSTYTFEPLIGMTSSCDANHKITYYEYDSFGRLKLIRDQDKNILKTFEYKYQEVQQ